MHATRNRRFPLLAALIAAAALVVLAALAVPPPASAGNGHFLHGVGAVNSAMGGAGAALPNDTLGALNLNPALLTELDGSSFEFSAEYPKAGNAVTSQVGPFSGRTAENGRTPLIPAFGFTRHPQDRTYAYGVGFLGLAGFGVDYPQDASNPLLAPQPRGFGRVYANYQFLKVPIVAALRLDDSWSVGVAFVTGRSSLTADPAGFAAPDCSPAGCFYPRVATDSAFGYAGQVGVHYRPTRRLAFGASYTTRQSFQSFEWNSAHANPGLPDFGTARRISFRLDNPATAVAGVAFTPLPELKLALDGKWIDYAGARGFNGFGIAPDGHALGLGWRSIGVVDLGGQYQATPAVALRLGYNHTQNAIPDRAAFFNVASPAIWSNHVTGGVGVRFDSALTLNLAYYYALKTRIHGPIVSPAGPVPGTLVTDEQSLRSVIASFSFKL
jgi:long-chain fatty acid transport protein